jgi:NADH dehydrogenase
MAVVGKNYAVLERGWIRTSGFLTWMVWVFVHILSLPQEQNRLRVQRQWLWSYFTGQRSSRLIPEMPQTARHEIDRGASTGNDHGHPDDGAPLRARTAHN